MNTGIKARWCEALRSGQYEQGQTKLRSSDKKFCCLGVLCDVLDSSKWQLDEIRERYFWDNNEDGVWDASLPPGVLDTVGLSHEMEWELISLNDRGHPFSEITQYIEQKL